MQRSKNSEERKKKAFLSDQCKEIEENNRLGKSRDLFRRRQWHPTPVLLPEKSHGQRSLVGCSPWVLEELDMTERLRFRFSLSCMRVKSESEVTQSCLTVSDPMDCRPSGSSAHGIFQARVLEWGAIAFSRRRYLSCVVIMVHWKRP